MTKKDEINKSKIIIGIGAFAIIAIAIIGVISFFTPKSHAQVQGSQFDKVAVKGLSKVYSKALKGAYKEWSKEYTNKDQEFKAVSFVKSFGNFRDKQQAAHKVVVFKAQKTALAFAKPKDSEQFFSVKSFAKYENGVFNVKAVFGKEYLS